MLMEERIVPSEEKNEKKQSSNNKETTMKLYKAKIKFYFAFGYDKEIVNVIANNIKEAIDKIHNKYDQDMGRSYSHPAFIIKIKEVK